MAKRGIIGFKGVTLAPITADTVLAYTTGAAVALQFAGNMSRTPKENTQDFYYDDDLYAQIRNNVGEDVELRVAEVPLAQLETLGLGSFDEDSQTFEADFSISGKYFSTRFVLDTIDGLPFYALYRVFQVTNVRFDNFQTKNNSPAVCEVIITGVFKRPQLAGLKPWMMMQLKEDKSNQDECNALLSLAEPYAITYNGGAGTGTMAAATAFAGKKFTLPSNAFTYEAHTFTGWTINGVLMQPGDTAVFKGPTTVAATWSE